MEDKYVWTVQFRRSSEKQGHWNSWEVCDSEETAKRFVEMLFGGEKLTWFALPSAPNNPRCRRLLDRTLQTFMIVRQRIYTSRDQDEWEAKREASSSNQQG